MLAQLAADARLLVAAEGRADVEFQVSVDPNSSGLERARYFMGAADIAGPDRGGQPVGSIIALEDRVVFVLERDDRGDWAEDLFAGDAHVVFHASENRRIDVITFARTGIASDRHVRALGLAERQV